MKTACFNFDLPANLIAQEPSPERGKSRLMVLDRETGNREHRVVRDLPLLLEKGTLLVYNNSRVRKARLLGISESSGARSEFLLLKKIDDLSWLVLAKRAGRKRPGSIYVFDDGVKAALSPAGGDWQGNKGEGGMMLRFTHPIDDDWLDKYGHVPLPPYIKRKDSLMDSERYQTVYAGQTGSAAAPTAGLHFTKELLAELEAAGMEMVFITLHVGLGTFLPVRVENVEDHVMHEEAFHIGAEEAEKIEKAKREKRKVLAVGTTSLRSLESACGLSEFGAFPEKNFGLRKNSLEGYTSIFIYPGYKFKVVDQLFTNFHTPMSTLLMLVSAFAGDRIPGKNGEIPGQIPGRDLILESYREAVKEGYRFFSYGDAMLIR